MAVVLLMAAPAGAQEAPAPPGSIHTVADHFYSVAPAPDWVRPVEPDLGSPHPFTGDIRPGSYFRMVDYQVNAETGEEYLHYAEEFLTVAGVHDDSEFEIEYDPAYQRLIFHRIRLHRDGEVRDILDPESIRITVPEDELDEGLLDGHVSLVVFLKDIRPGDVVEYDYTLAGRNPVFDGLFLDTIPLEWETSVQAMRYRLVKRVDRPLKAQNHRVEIAPEKRPLPGGALEEWIWSREKIPPRHVETSLPRWFRPFAYVELSEFDSWKQVAEWGARHYDFDALPIDPDLAQEIEAIRARHTKPADRALAAIRFVQDSIRYLGIEDGANAFRPAQPGLCFQRRFGDCKDKTVLLGQILRELGIESDPVCVSHQWEGTVAEMLPSPMAFDHVICRIRTPEGKYVWCDATSSHQGGRLDTLAFPDYGKGLVLNTETTDLADLPVPDSARHRVDIVETFEVGGIGKPSLIGIETTYTGSEADYLRYQLESEEPESVRQTYLDYYRENYNEIEIDGPIEVIDDRDGNRLIVKERYRLPDPWTPDEDSEPGWYTMTLYLQGIRDMLSRADHTRRTAPLRVRHPVNRSQEIRLKLPGTDEDWSGFFDEDRHVFRSAAGTFERWMTYDADKVEATVNATYRSTADHVVPAHLEKHQQAISDAYDLTSIELWEIDKSKQTASAAAEDAEELAEEWTEGEIAILMIGIIGAALVGIIGIGIGAVVTALVMRSRNQSARAAASVPPLPAAASPTRRGPPPLPPAGPA